MKIKTSELTGRALDWAVAKADGRGVKINELGYVFVCDNRSIGVYSPSTDWAKCGELIDTHLIELNNQVISENEVEHWATCMDEYIYGSTALEAACRIVVHVKLGDEVEIPDELLEGV
ncbi:phage protein NinX family protein [Xenorhabdus bovienii]|uniref:phage protein NinX family protein n=1 Tax=Xenorhabdus bovienii TaxID=40576 RepID=UPI0023B29DC9|nr:phage protein NinX family protein [Xenorhabdus bovienii]MDE9463524.1 DUF2591 domain-containing protein [Xenorhabdus bovienii]